MKFYAAFFVGLFLCAWAGMPSASLQEQRDPNVNMHDIEAAIDTSGWYVSKKNLLGTEDEDEPKPTGNLSGAVKVKLDSDFKQNLVDAGLALHFQIQTAKGKAEINIFSDTGTSSAAGPDLKDKEVVFGVPFSSEKIIERFQSVAKSFKVTEVSDPNKEIVYTWAFVTNASDPNPKKFDDAMVKDRTLKFEADADDEGKFKASDSVTEPDADLGVEGVGNLWIKTEKKKKEKEK